jgi:phosphogluconate dehydratase
VNAFQEAGGPSYVIRELLDSGLMHEDVLTVRPNGFREYTGIPAMENDKIVWNVAGPTPDDTVLRPVSAPFSQNGGIKVLRGNLGRSVIKISAVPTDLHVIQAPAKVFDSQEALLAAFAAGELDHDVVCVVRWQGPHANGMPELHKLTPPLKALQSKGFDVALVTDGRMSGASGKIPAAIHVSPEAAAGGPLAKVRDGDLIRLDAINGELNVLIDPTEWAAREPARMPQAQKNANNAGIGRELFAGLRHNVTSAEEGACTWL